MNLEDHDEDESPSRAGSMGPDGVGAGGGASVRKAQNRIAQREFRLRKQQYIRDLEARVEVLSGDKEERVDLMTLLIRNLLKENKDLRSMLKDMTSFVGEGLGSCLPRLGLNATQLDAILNRGDTDSAHDAFLALKASKEMEEANPGIALGHVKRKTSTIIPGSKRKHEGDHDHVSEGTSTPGGDKKYKDTRTPGPDTTLNQQASTSQLPQSMQPPLQQGQQNIPVTNYDFFFPDLEAMANGRYQAPQPTTPFNPYAYNNPPNTYQNQPPNPSGPSWAQGTDQQFPYGMGMGFGFGPNSQNQANFTGFGLTVPAPPLTPGAPGPSTSVPVQPVQPTGQAQSGDVEEETEKSKRLKEAVASLTVGDRRALEGTPMTPDEMAERFRVQEKLMNSLPENDQNNRMLEAMQMITYHLNNYRVNPNYVLPPSLRPTKVQKTIAHEHAIDGLVFPSVRDRMILLRGRYDIVEAFYAILNGFTLHGEDPLDHNNWELSERWLTEFRILCDDEVFDITNRWRATRGEMAIPKADNPIMRGDYGSQGMFGQPQ